MNEAIEKIRNLTTLEIIEAFEATETSNSEEIPMVRGWLMDVLEERDEQAFESYLDSAADSPRQFFI